MTELSGNPLTILVSKHPNVALVVVLLSWIALLWALLVGRINIGPLSSNKYPEKETVHDTIQIKIPCPEMPSDYNIVYVSTSSPGDVRMLKEPKEDKSDDNTLAFLPQETALILLSKSPNFDIFENERGQWYKVRFFEKVGWIWGGRVKEGKPFTKNPTKNQFSLIGNRVNFYTQPVNETKLENRYLITGDVVTVESEIGEFYYVTYKNDKTKRKGYVKKEALQKLTINE
jgi:hypothetical protein